MIRLSKYIASEGLYAILMEIIFVFAGISYLTETVLEFKADES